MSQSTSALALALLAASPFRLVAQVVPVPKSFEVASVRKHQGYVMRTEPFAVSGLIRLEGYTVFALVMDAYHLRDFQLKFAAAAPDDDFFDTQYDIVARAPGERAPSLDDARVMLQSLLADRFKMSVHRETKEVPVYALQLGKKGPKLKANSADGPCSVKTNAASDGRNREDIFTNCPIERLADRLGNLMDSRPVLDQTGLKGQFDFRLVAIPEYKTRKQSDAAD
jgi:uncharacterized protein (TIGR03435 family)